MGRTGIRENDYTLCRSSLGEGLEKARKSYLVRRLIRVVQSSTVGTTKQKHSRARFLIVHCTHMQRCVAAGVPTVHVGPICQQVFQVMNQAVATGLQRNEINLEHGLVSSGNHLFSPEVGPISVFVKGVAKLHRFPITAFECLLN